MPPASHKKRLLMLSQLFGLESPKPAIAYLFLMAPKKNPVSLSKFVAFQIALDHLDIPSSSCEVKLSHNLSSSLLYRTKKTWPAG